MSAHEDKRTSQETQHLGHPPMLRAGATSFYHADGLGSITSLSNPAGALAQTYTFDSFGNQTGSSGSLTNPFRYTARELDTETSLYYYRARYYDPGAGRFVSEDKFRFGGGYNFYEYVANNVTGSKDPYGLAPADNAYRVGLYPPSLFWSLEEASYYDCANAVKRQFNHFSREGHPRYAHCMASCTLTKNCGGRTAAFLAGIGKEVLDTEDCLKTGNGTACNTAFQWSDLKDNWKGLTCPKNKPCAEKCADLRNEPDAAPSWLFYRWPFLRHANK